MRNACGIETFFVTLHHNSKQVKPNKLLTTMAKSVRIRFACEVYFDNVQGDTNEEVRHNALKEFENLPIFSADALDKFADVVDVENVEDEENGNEL